MYIHINKCVESNEIKSLTDGHLSHSQIFMTKVINQL